MVLRARSLGQYGRSWRSRAGGRLSAYLEFVFGGRGVGCDRTAFDQPCQASRESRMPFSIGKASFIQIHLGCDSLHIVDVRRELHLPLMIRFEYVTALSASQLLKNGVLNWRIRWGCCSTVQSG